MDHPDSVGNSYHDGMSSPHADIDWQESIPGEGSPGSLLKMQWRNLLFMHWRVDAQAMKPLLPQGLQLDTFDGCAWVGLIPFTMDRTRPRGIPPLPGVSRFHECNVRTYVLHDGIPGVWFFSLDAASRLAVMGGRGLWKLNYIHASFDVTKKENTTDYALRRSDGTTSRISWTTGDALPRSESGSLRHFLTERYCLYSAKSGKIWRGAIHHKPWKLREARVNALEDHLVLKAGIEAEGMPICMAADDVDVKAWALKRVR